MISSFLNVLIYRIPKKENIVTTVVSLHELRLPAEVVRPRTAVQLPGTGRQMSEMQAHISVQYPVIEALNGVLYLLVFWKYGMSVDSLVYCLLFSALLALSVIDFRTYEIPVGFNLFILALGLIHGAFHYTQWLEFGIGFLCVSVFLLLLYYVTGGRAIGGGDVKLMAVCGLLLGWKLIIFAFLLGCIIGSVIHLIRMRQAAKDMSSPWDRLSAGVAIAVLWGNEFLQWYLHFYL